MYKAKKKFNEQNRDMLVLWKISIHMHRCLRLRARFTHESACETAGKYICDVI